MRNHTCRKAFSGTIIDWYILHINALHLIIMHAVFYLILYVYISAF